MPNIIEQGSPTAGGIVYCEDSYFYNNKVDIQFYPFQNTNPGSGANFRNLSYFTQCEFITNELYYENYTENDPPDAHIKNVQG